MKKIITAILTTILLSALGSAYTGWNWGYSNFSPADLLNNEWVVWGLIFIIFFAIIFFSVSKTFKQNLGISAVVAGALSLFISVIFARRVTFYGYVGEELASWITFIALMIIIVFFLKAVYDSLGKVGLGAGLIGTWLFLHYFDLESVLGYYITENSLFLFIRSGWGLVIAIVITVIFLSRFAKTAGGGFTIIPGSSRHS